MPRSPTGWRCGATGRSGGSAPRSTGCISSATATPPATSASSRRRTIAEVSPRCSRPPRLGCGARGMRRGDRPVQSLDQRRVRPAGRRLRHAAVDDDGPCTAPTTAHARGAGLPQGKDLIAYDFDVAATGRRAAKRMLQRLARPPGSASGRSTCAASTASSQLIVDIFNDAWSDNWGFVPMTEAEVRHTGPEPAA